MMHIDATPFVSVEPGAYQTQSQRDLRSRMHEFEDHLKTMPPLDLPLDEQFCDGVYMRTIFIPAGAVLTGLVHRFDCLNIVHGDITVTSEEGRKRIIALDKPARFHSIPGIKRAGWAHADTWWTTVHANPTNERDSGKLLAMYAYDDRALIEHESKEVLT